jgi:hypothetical protein
MEMRERGSNGLQQLVTDLCRVLGLEMFHPHDSRKSEPGYPDCTIVDVKRYRIIYAELKRQRTRPTEAQARWLDALALVADKSAGRVEVVLWRPSHWLDGSIERILRGEDAIKGRDSIWEHGLGVRGDKFSKIAGGKLRKVGNVSI